MLDQGPDFATKHPEAWEAVNEIFCSIFDRFSDPASVVVCVWNPKRNAIKIGCTSKPKHYFGNLQSASPDPLVYWAQMPGRFVDKSVWHDTLSKYGLHLRGDWFDASNGLILKAFLNFAIEHGGSMSPSEPEWPQITSEAQ